MKRPIYIFTSLLCICSSVAFAQQFEPAYLNVGRDELAGIDVYGITQGHDNKIWMSTNNGIYSYDGRQFTAHSVEASSSSSFFDIRVGDNGTIQFYNMRGEMFEKTTEGQFELTYRIPRQLIENYSAIISTKNYKVFMSKGMYLEKDGKLSLLDSAKKNISIGYLNNGKVCVSKSNGEFIIVNDDGITELAGFRVSEQTVQGFYLSSVNIGTTDVLAQRPTNVTNKWVVKANFESGTYTYCQFDTSYADVLLKQFYMLNDSVMWWTSETGGIYEFVLEDTEQPLKHRRLLYSDVRISTCTKDSEGNVWLGTLGEGLLKIPSMHVEYISPEKTKNQLITELNNAPNHSVFLGGNKGTVFEVSEKNLKELGEVRDRLINVVSLSSSKVLANATIIPDGVEVAGLGSVKDAVKWGTGFLTASNIGISFLSDRSVNQNQTDTLSKVFQFSVEDQHGIWRIAEDRIYSIDYDKKNDIIWAASINGLMRIDKSGIEYLKWKGHQINAIGLQHINGLCYVATSNSGIIAFDSNGKGQSILSEVEQFKTEGISKFESNSSRLLISSGSHIYVYNSLSKNYMRLPNSLFYNSGKMIDFCIEKDKLWVSYIDGVRIFDLSNIGINETASPLNVEYVLINGKKKGIGHLKQLAYDQNNIELAFSAITFTHQEAVKYRYRLLGLDNVWRELNYSNSKIVLPDLSPGSFKIEVQSINADGVYSKSMIIPVSIDAPYWQKAWFYGVLVLGGVVLVAIIALLRLRYVRRKLELDKRLKSSEVTAIKAQMNPHFMFNALNSVQDLIHLDDKRNSSIYLSKVATLMRKTLDNSSKDNVSLAEEMDVLSLYLDLEKLRFGSELTVSLINDISEQKLEEIQVPPMIIQPYIENAFKHGLLHKSGDKHIAVSFVLDPSFLVVTVEDNGIGIEKSRAINQRRSKDHKSFGTSATQKRIDLINSMLSDKIQVSISALSNDNDYPGTKVELKFPVQPFNF